jgi:SAM-dependent methyltransferase
VSHAFYTSLAPWWPLISPVEDYAEEAAYAATLLERAARPVRDVLELGCGGGSNAAHLRERYTMTLTDLSEDMLAVSRALNPGCRHVAGDMRTLRLGEAFDAVFVHDSIDYMTDERGLADAFATARAHLRPGGVLVVIPDVTAETFQPDTDCGGTDGPDGRAARYLAWTTRPDPDGTTVLTEYAFLLRSADGRVTSRHEAHRTGVFPETTWLRLLAEAGLTPERLVEETTEDRPPRTVFVAHAPAS